MAQLERGVGFKVVFWGQTSPRQAIIAPKSKQKRDQLGHNVNEHHTLYNKSCEEVTFLLFLFCLSFFRLFGLV